MSNEIEVPLSRSYEIFDKSFRSVTLRRPRLADHFEIGDPVELHHGPDGQGRYVIEHMDRISKYLDRLAVPDKPGLAALQTLDLADALTLRDAITGFFTEALRLRKQATNSSSGQDNPSGTSAT